MVNSDPRWKTTAAVFFFLQPKVNSWAVFGRFSRTIFVLLMGRYELLCRSVWHIIVRDKHVVGSMGAGGDWDVIHYFLGKSQE